MVLSFSSLAQDVLLGFQLKNGIATEDFYKESGSLIVPELAFLANYHIPNLPLEVGFNLGYGLYGTQLEKRNDLYVGSNDFLRLRRNNNVLSMAGLFRLFPQVYGNIFPFVEAQVGAIYAFTRYKIREKPIFEPIEEGRDIGKLARMNQIGGGVLIPLGKDSNVFLELRLMYQNTGKLDYLTRGDVSFRPDPHRRAEGEFEYNIRRSSFNLIQLSIGLSLYSD